MNNRIAMTGLAALVLGACSPKDVSNQDTNMLTYTDDRPIPATGNGGAAALTAGYFNSDNTLDVAIGDVNGVRLYLGQKNENHKFAYYAKLTGNVDYGIVPRRSMQNDGALSLACADINLDGKTDFLIGDVNGLSISYQQPDGTFRNTPLSSTAITYRTSGGASGLALTSSQNGSMPLTALVGDVNGVSTQSLVLDQLQYGTRLEGPITSRTSNGDGVCGAGAGDLNGDGIPEFVIGDENGITIFQKKGDSYITKTPHIFRDVVTSRNGEKACGITVADFDHDGKNDVAVFDLNGVRVYPNSGNSQFTLNPVPITFLQEKR